MKTFTTSLVLATALAMSAAAADVSVKLSDVHLCCKGCSKGVEKAVAKVSGAQAAADQDAGTVTITGPDKATVQKAADAFAEGGYFGKSENESIKPHAESGAKDKQVKSVKIQGVHLCCGECVSAVDAALKKVDGVKAHTAVKNAQAFEVTGNFNDKQAIEALRAAGLNGKIVN